MRTAYLVVVPSLKPQFLRDLLEILGRPSNVRFIVSSKEISKAALRIGETEGVKLEDRYISGVPVHLDGNASPERLLAIYEEWIRYRERLEGDRKLWPEGLREGPKIGIKEIRWHGEDYNIKFDEYSLEIDIGANRKEMLSDLIECARTYDLKIRINLRASEGSK